MVNKKTMPSCVRVDSKHVDSDSYSGSCRFGVTFLLLLIGCFGSGGKRLLEHDLVFLILFFHATRQMYAVHALRFTTGRCTYM